MIDVTLYHDGCTFCQGIGAAMKTVFATPGHRFESVNLALQAKWAAKAAALGVKRLPSLVVNRQVMRLEDHSPIEHYL